MTLASGHTIQVDEEDAPLVRAYQWHAYDMSGKLRVVTTGPRLPDGRRPMFQLARLITRAPARRPIRHKIGDTLDLRRANLIVGGRDRRPSIR